MVHRKLFRTGIRRKMLFLMSAPSGAIQRFSGKTVYNGLYTQKRRSGQSGRILYHGLRIFREMRKLQRIQRCNLPVLRTSCRMLKTKNRLETSKAIKAESGFYRFFYPYRRSLDRRLNCACLPLCSKFRNVLRASFYIPRSSPTRTTLIFFGGRQILVVTI